jgi:phosphoribosylamine--glycine ligase
VVLAAGGYPGAYEKGLPIVGLERDWADTTKVFHAGTRAAGTETVTDGGRVLCVSALGDSVADAIANAYAGVDLVTWKDMTFRRDIGWRAIDR